MHRLILALTACLLSACNLLSPYSDMTKIDLQISATDALNPDLHGRPSPVVLQLVELRHPVAFEQADFFALQQLPQFMGCRQRIVHIFQHYVLHHDLSVRFEYVDSSHHYHRWTW